MGKWQMASLKLVAWQLPIGFNNKVAKHRRREEVNEFATAASSWFHLLLPAFGLRYLRGLTFSFLIHFSPFFLLFFCFRRAIFHHHHVISVNSIFNIRIRYRCFRPCALGPYYSRPRLNTKL